MNVLVIAPHPDDEVLGCGGTIKKYSEKGEEVFLCIVTKPYTPDWSEEYIENKKKEIKASNDILGIKKTFFLDLPTVKLDTLPQKQLNDAISQCVAEVNPKIVFIPFFGDINKDHQLVSEASMVAVRPKPSSSVKKAYYYEVLSETEWGKKPNHIDQVFLPNHFENITEFLDEKVKAMECYQSELKEMPHPRSLEGISVLAKKRGMEVGVRAAEAFMLLREINS